jgi:peroxiredoxin
MPFTAKVFAQKYNLEFPLLSDYNRNVIRQYDLLLSNFAGLPGLDSTKRAVYLIDGDGVLRYMEITATPHDEPDYTKLFDALKAL